MRMHRPEILLVEHDAALTEMIGEHVETVLRAHVTHVRTAGEAVTFCTDQAPDVIVSEMQLPDADGLSLTRTVRMHLELDSGIILLSGQLTVGRAVEAMRLGVRDLFTKPFDVQRLSHVIEQETLERRDRQRALRRQKRLRRLAGRMIRDRRDLRQRIDLICRDLVTAYQRLAQRVAECQPTRCDD